MNLLSHFMSDFIFFYHVLWGCFLYFITFYVFILSSKLSIYFSHLYPLLHTFLYIPWLSQNTANTALQIIHKIILPIILTIVIPIVNCHTQHLLILKSISYQFAFLIIYLYHHICPIKRTHFIKATDSFLWLLWLTQYKTQYKRIYSSVSIILSRYSGLFSNVYIIGGHFDFCIYLNLNPKNSTFHPYPLYLVFHGAIGCSLTLATISSSSKNNSGR